MSTIVYTTEATATGGGRNHGRAVSADGALDVTLTVPKAMGGDGAPGTNPEQLFAAGYAVGFQGALGVVARKEKADISGSTVTAAVSIGKTEAGGFGLEVAISASIPNLDAKTARSLVEKAHQVCPYSNATRGNITVDLSVV